MNVPRIARAYAITTMVVLGATLGLNSRSVAQTPAPPVQEGVEVLTRGPVHEAFAETITFDPQPGIVIAETPPDAIEEVAPDQRPEGTNVTWIPGYWGWDDERSDFLWVSGIWRALPPGRQWVPGYWGESPQGSQWISGYWANAEASEVDFLPEPPATVEVGPNIAAPSPDHIWLPGSWVWQQNRYGWRAGFWSKGNQDWDWVPDHYIWTPRGYIFVDGYYDYSVSRRGVVFAPVRFLRALRSQRGFSYSPSTVINLGVFARHLFLRPSYGHYYFGDYYGSNYKRSGYSPWFSFQSSHRGYDPIFANQRWNNRHDLGWEQRAAANFQNYRDNEGPRPPRNWAAQAALAESRETPHRGSFSVATPLDELARSKEGQQRFIPVDPAEHQQFVQRRQEYRNYLQKRQQLEANTAHAPDVVSRNAVEPVRSTFGRSPFVAQPIDQLSKGALPPRRHEVLKPDFQVQPQPRSRAGAPGSRSIIGPSGGGQIQNGSVDQLRRQTLNQGNRQGESTGQLRVEGTNRGNNHQGSSDSQQRGSSQSKNKGKSDH